MGKGNGEQYYPDLSHMFVSHGPLSGINSGGHMSPKLQCGAVYRTRPHDRTRPESAVISFVEGRPGLPALLCMSRLRRKIMR